LHQVAARHSANPKRLIQQREAHRDVGSVNTDGFVGTRFSLKDDVPSEAFADGFDSRP